MIDLNEVVGFNEVSLFRTVEREGYIFTSITPPSNVFDAIVIKYPQDISCFSPTINGSRHSLEEQISFINEHKVEKALIIAGDIEFITMCPSLKFLRVIPPDNVGNDFDYSPLYKMPQIRGLQCSTVYGYGDEFFTTIDCSKINGLEDITVSNSHYKNYDVVKTLKNLCVSNYKGIDLSDLFNSSILDSLDMIQCNIGSLNGLEKAKKINSVALQYIRNLRDISSLVRVSSTLKILVIENCPKIEDFSCLYELTELEHLELHGKNKLPSLAFLRKMKNLKTISFSMEIEDGDLTPCLKVPYAHCSKCKKYYNLKDKDLPKSIKKTGDGSLS